MSVVDRLTNVPPAVLADPSVQEMIRQIDAESSGVDTNAAAVVTASPPDLTKYGIRLRTSGLMQQTMMLRVIGALKKHGLATESDNRVRFNVPDEYQPFIWTFILGANLTDVYKMLDVLDREGLSPAMAAVHQWFDGLNVPADASMDVLQAMTNSFELAMKAMKATPEGEVDEKKAVTGSSMSSTSSRTNTGGRKK